MQIVVLYLHPLATDCGSGMPVVLSKVFLLFALKYRDLKWKILPWFRNFRFRWISLAVLAFVGACWQRLHAGKGV